MAPPLSQPLKPNSLVFVVRNVATTTFHLEAGEEDRETIERVLEVYADSCPVARSIRESIEIRSELDLTTA
jgi:uncharacterized OsmC-like protein